MDTDRLEAALVDLAADLPEKPLGEALNDPGFVVQWPLPKKRVHAMMKDSGVSPPSFMQPAPEPSAVSRRFEHREETQGE